jgi:hypothetical protein
MDTETAGPHSPLDWRRSHALGLPAGSIRALLAILIFATAWALLLFKPSQEVPDYFRDLLFIIMGHYFASRHRADRVDESGPPPLYLPSGSVRLVLVAGCVAVAVLLYRRGQLTALEENPAVVTLLLVVVLSAVFTWWKGRGHRPPRIVEDLRALIALAAAATLVVLVLNRFLFLFPPGRVDTLFVRRLHLGRYGPEHVLAAVVGFYFGSRS